MKNQFLSRLWILCPFLIFCCSSLQAQWQFQGSPETGLPLDYSYTSDRIYMAANAGLFYSTDNGNSWNNVPLPDSISSINTVYETNGRLFLFNRSNYYDPFIRSAAYRSDDNGQTWKSIFPFDPSIWGGLHPVFKGDTLIFMVSGVMAISFDLGDTYEIVPSGLSDADKIFFHGNLLMGTTYNVLYSSPDLGENWDTVYVSPDSLISFTVTSIDNRLFKYEQYYSFPAFQGIISVSEDNGLTWEVTATLDDPFFSSPLIFGDSQHLFLAETQANDILYHSTDGGVVWEIITTPESFVAYQYLKGILFGLRSDYWGYFGDGVWLSYDQGHSFQSNTTGFFGADCEEIIAGTDQLWVNANTKYYRNENGNQWPEFSYYENLVAADELHLMAYVNGVLKRSYDGGQLWYTVPTSLFNESNYNSFREIHGSGHLFFVNVFPDLWYSTDFGESWEIFNELNNEEITDIFYDGLTYVISGDLGTVLRSEDGSVWEDITYDIWAPGVASIQMVHSQGGYVYALTGSGNVILRPGSTTWEFFEVEDPHQFTFSPELEIASMAHQGNILLGTVYGHGVFYSVNNGTTWRPFNLGLTDFQARDIEIVGDKIYLAVSGGVWNRSLSDLILFAYSGTVFNDLNDNGIREGNEPGLKNVIVRKHVENSAVSTETDGSFFLYSQTNQTDTISATPPSPYAYVTTPPVYVTEPDSQLLIGIHFIPGIYDGSVVITNTTPFRPGFESTITITYKNKGTETADLNIRFAMPDELEYISASPDPTFLLDTLYWNLNDIAPGTGGNILVSVKVDASVPIGTLIDLYGFIKVSEEGDANPADNETLVTVEVVGSYDPNDKAVFPSGFITPAMIADTARLEYTIRFQNTGNFPATFVRIQDTLSSNLDLTSLEILAASHPYSWKLLPHNVLDVYFDNINLPDSTSDERGSHGFVKIALNAKSSLRLADNIENRAYIYFDFNSPVVTNTVGSTVGFETGIKDPMKQLALSVVPMPVKDILYINVEVPVVQGDVFLSLYDARGSFISSQRSSSLTNIQMNVRDLPSGLYFLQARIADHYGMVKVVKN